MTSNVGSDYINKMQSIGFNTKEDVAERENMREKAMDSLKEQFRPEFLNRIDEIVIFNYLQKVDIKKIVDLELSKVQKRLAAKEITIRISEKVKEFLAKEGFDANLGARPLKRVIQRLILDPLSNQIVSEELREGDNLIIDMAGEKITFNVPKLLPKVKESEKLFSAK